MNSVQEEDHLRHLFRGAATHVTQLYMYAQRQEKMAYKKGYHEGLESVLQFLTESSDKISGTIQIKPLAEFVKKLQIQMQLSTSQSAPASNMNIPPPKNAQMEVDMSSPHQNNLNNHNTNGVVNLSNNSNVLNNVVNNVNSLNNNNRPPSLFPFGGDSINHDNNNNLINNNHININNNNNIMPTPNPFGFGNHSQNNNPLNPMSSIHINQDQQIHQQQQQQQHIQQQTQQQHTEYNNNPKNTKKRGYFEYYFDSNPPPVSQTTCASNTQLSLNTPLIPPVPTSSPSLHPFFETDYTNIQHNHNLMGFNSSQGGLSKRARLGD
eukprot:TRINITY_DN2771_c0_g1_i1.p1 TRINITY_DN2771_c0_g1~~TRINITY_DN2771_c0_g1_i1.p1  ORF type:complete len:322 (-),score=84.56 TRINITY_DN2771_c0_g1_i1:78-1043(-)